MADGQAPAAFGTHVGTTPGEMMETVTRAEYDSDVDALQIYLTDAPTWAGGKDVLGHQVDYDESGAPAGVELLSPALHIDDLVMIAAEIGVDGERLTAIARAALATPDRSVVVGESGVPRPETIDEAIDRRRRDPEFMGQLARIMEEDKAVLDRLADS